MASYIPIYVVPENQLKAAVGCKDDALLEKIVGNSSNGLQVPLPEQLSTRELISAMIGRPPLRAALQKILYGGSQRKPRGWFYLNAYELLVRHFSLGYFEDWNQVSRAGEWVQNIHTALPSIEVDIDLNRLLFGGSLIDLPRDENVDIELGYWRSDLVKSYKKQIDRYLASDICESDADPMRALNYPLHDVGQWLDEASQHDDGAVVAFYF